MEKNRAFFAGVLATAVVLSVVLACCSGGRRAEGFVSGSCSGKHIAPGVSTELSTATKCSPNSPFASLKQHPTEPESCYLPLEEPIVHDNPQGCSTANAALSGISGLSAAAIDSDIDCIRSYCKVTFQSTTAPQREGATRQMFDANVRSAPVYARLSSEHDALKGRFDTLTRAYDIMAREKLKCTTSLASTQGELAVCQRDRDGLRSEYAKCSADGARCRAENASCSAEAANTRAGLASCQQSNASAAQSLAAMTSAQALHSIQGGTSVTKTQAASPIIQRLVKKTPAPKKAKAQAAKKAAPAAKKAAPAAKKAAPAAKKKK